MKYRLPGAATPAIVLILSLGLAGCFEAPPPTNDEIKDAEQRLLFAMFGDDTPDVVESVRDSSCTAAEPSPALKDKVKGKPLFECSFIATIFNKNTNERRVSDKKGHPILVKTDDKWHLVLNDSIAP